ncbi:MAG TPA: GGDEF domain-containing protein [Candidatus Aquabacterium excrementipullorum]|nr:GGDEF domain-containing protein [Candidatus Aquabacterium excrementipullorum]
MREPDVRPHPLTLRFRNPAQECAYRTATLPRLRWHGRVALWVGLAVYLVFGLLDKHYVPGHLLPYAWSVRAFGALGALALFAFSWQPQYARRGSEALMVLGLGAGLSLLGIFWMLPPQSLEYYYAGLVLVIFYTYNFSGTRFVHALVANAVLLAAYNLLYGWLRPLPPEQWVGHNLYFISANVLGGTGAYLAEYHRRRLFVMERRLYADRQQYRHHALHDALTGLPNRMLLLDRIEQALTQARRTGVGGVVLFVDLDGFKSVNDTHGHAAGDQVLREAARRLRGCLRESDTLARLGGDEFVLLSQGVTSDEQLWALADKLRQVIETPFPVQRPGDEGVVYLLNLSASIGSCFFPGESEDAEELLQRSDEAMYRAKQALS